MKRLPLANNLPTIPGERPSITVRAHLWLPLRTLGAHSLDVMLWLHLSDSRVLAFRLPNTIGSDEKVISAVVNQVADDHGGYCCAFDLPGVGSVQVLYAAPVLPIPKNGHGGALFDPDIQRFAASLDAEVMRLLLSLEREPPPAIDGRHAFEEPNPLTTCFFVSVRNYNRLSAQLPTQRLQRMQALSRFPALLAPLMLTAHRGPHLGDGKRHAWREKDEVMDTVIDQGKNLVGALARHYGISKSLVRAPINAVMWPAPAHATRIAWLRLLDALPDNQRPTLAEFECWRSYLSAYFYLLGTETLDPPPQQLAAAHRGAFRLGWTRTWKLANQRFDDLRAALTDCRDFLNAARAAAALHRRHGPNMHRLAAGWLGCHGLLGLLAASARWHERRPLFDRWQVAGDNLLPAVLGHWAADGHLAEELRSPEALAHEGEVMKHCVASYWPKSVAGDRIFALRLADGERATAQYSPTMHHDNGNIDYRLVQLRGPCNRQVGEQMRTWARIIEHQLNAPERYQARRAALNTLTLIDELRRKSPRTARLDTTSERQLQAVLNWLGLHAPAAETLLCGHIAGFQYYAGPMLEAQLAVGQPLQLIREADNPHDPSAVRMDWQGHKLGYVPRPDNAEIAERLDAGERLTARIIAREVWAEIWQRVTFAIETATD